MSDLYDLEDNALEMVGVSDPEVARKRFEAALPENPWGLSEKGLSARKAAGTMIRLKTGMYTPIPIICKADSCPYSESCSLLSYDLAPEGEFCPVEIAKIEALVQGYYSDFELDEMSFTDRSLVNEVVGLDIMIDRCKALMAKEGTPVIDVVIGIAENGAEIRQPAVSKSIEAYEKLTKRKDQKLQFLAKTNRDRQRFSVEQNKDSWIQSVTEVITADDLEESNKMR